MQLNGRRDLIHIAVGVVGEVIAVTSWIVERRAAAEVNFVQVGCMIAVVAAVFNYGLSFALALESQASKSVSISRRFLRAAVLSGVVALVQSLFLVAIVLNEKSHVSTFVRVMVLLLPVPLLLICNRLGVMRREVE
jgi:hypothetical protein